MTTQGKLAVDKDSVGNGYCQLLWNFWQHIIDALRKSRGGAALASVA
jgi:hypothetical protein